MKNLSYLLLAFMAVGLWSCQSDKDVPLFQEKDMMGLHEGIWTRISYNEEPREDLQIILLDPENDEKYYCDQMGMKLDPSNKYAIIPNLHCIYGTKDIDFIKYKNAEMYPDGCDFTFSAVAIPIEISVNHEDITFEGAVTMPVRGGGNAVWSVKGRYGHNPKKVTVLSADVKYEIDRNSLIGNTFELKIDEESFYPDILSSGMIRYEGADIDSGELLKRYYEILRSNFPANTGGDAIRFALGLDGTVTHEIHIKESGSYDMKETSEFHIGNFRDIFFYYSNASIENQIDRFSSPGRKWLGSSKGLCWVRGGNSNGMSFQWLIDGDELVLTPTMLKYHEYADWSYIDDCFIRSWYHGNDSQPDQELAKALLKEIDSGRLVFKPVFKARRLSKLTK